MMVVTRAPLSEASTNVKHRVVRVVLALAAVGLISAGIRSLVAWRRQSSSTSLKTVATEVNRMLPAMLGTDIQLVHTVAVEGKFVYQLRLVNYTGTAEEYRKDAPAIRTQLLEATCTNATAKDQLLGRGVTLQFNVESKDGRSLAVFQIHPEDCGF